MVKMNGCAAIDSARPFRFLADKAAVAADFHLRKWRLLTWETENSKQIKWAPLEKIAVLATC